MPKEIKPIFILGVDHSGTSILFKMLGRHPDFAWFSQFSCRGGEIPGRFRIPFHNQYNRAMRSLFLHNWHKKGGRIRIIPCPSEAHQIWEYIIPEQKSFSPEESIKRMRKIFEAECRDWRKPFIILKNLRLNQHIPVLREAYPEAKFIHIVRNGKAVALSIRHEFIFQKGLSEIEGLKAAAKYWVEILREINKEKENMLELKYEDFCNDVRGHIKKTLNFIGLDSSMFPFDKFPKKLTSTNPGWLNAATEEEIAILEEIEKEYFEIYNY